MPEQSGELNRLERRKKINRSAIVLISTCLIFGLIIPVWGLQEAPNFDHPLALELGGREIDRSLSSNYPHSVEYRFPLPRPILLKKLQSRLKEPEWTEWTDKHVFWGPHKEQIVLGVESESGTTAHFHWGKEPPNLLQELIYYKAISSFRDKKSTKP